MKAPTPTWLIIALAIVTTTAPAIAGLAPTTDEQTPSTEPTGESPDGTQPADAADVPVPAATQPLAGYSPIHEGLGNPHETQADPPPTWSDIRGHNDYGEPAPPANCRLPVSGAAGECPKWTATYNGEGHGSEKPQSGVFSPDGERLYITGKTETVDAMFPDSTIQDAMPRAHTVALDAQDGEVLWTQRDEPGLETYTTGNTIAISPDGDTVFVTGRIGESDGDSDVLTVAYRATDGEELWRQTHEDSTDVHPYRFDSSPSPSGDAIHVLAFGNERATSGVVGSVILLSYDSGTGELRWATEDTLLHESVGHNTNRESSSYHLEVRSQDGALFVSGLAGDGTNHYEDQDIVVARYDPATGEQVWSTQYSENDDPVQWTQNTVLTLSEDGSLLTAVGHSIPCPENRVKPAIFRTLHCSDNGPRYLVAVAFDADTGEVVWDTTVEFRCCAGGFTAASVTFSHDSEMLYVGGQINAFPQMAFIYAFDADTGGIVWEVEENPWVWETPKITLHAGLLRENPSDGTLTAVVERHFRGVEFWTIDSATGEIQDRTPVGPSASGAFLLRDDRVFFGDTVWGGDATLGDLHYSAFNLTDGQMVWERYVRAPNHAYDVAADVGVTPDGSRTIATGTSQTYGDGGDDWGESIATVAYDAANGQELWTDEYVSPLTGKPAKATALAVGPDSSHVAVTGSVDLGANGVQPVVLSYDLASGHRNWETNVTVSNFSETKLCIGDPSLQFCTSVAPKFTSLEFSPDGSTVYAAGYVGETVLSPSGLLDNDWIVAALDASTGDLIWTEVIDGDIDVPWGDMAFDLTTSDDGEKVIVVGRQTTHREGDDEASNVDAIDLAVEAFDASTGERLWSAAKNGGAPQSTVCKDEPYSVEVTGDRVFVAGYNQCFESALVVHRLYETLVAFDLGTGEELWHSSTPATIVTGPASATTEVIVGDGLVYQSGLLPTVTPVIRAHDPTTGALAWTWAGKAPSHLAVQFAALSDIEYESARDRVYYTGYFQSAPLVTFESWSGAVDGLTGADVWTAPQVRAKGWNMGAALDIHGDDVYVLELLDHRGRDYQTLAFDACPTCMPDEQDARPAVPEGVAS